MNTRSATALRALRPTDRPTTRGPTRLTTRTTTRLTARLAAPLAALLLAHGGPAAALDLLALDSGFVTEMGGSSKGDGTVVPVATYNYSAGFELHYGSGALGAPLAPMLRKNYFVFDLSGLSTPIAAASLSLWSGTLESADPTETWLLLATTGMAAALDLSAAIAGGSLPSAFDSPSDPLVVDAKTLYSVLADSPTVLAGLDISHTMDDSLLHIPFTPAGVAHLNAHLGGKLVVAGVVPSVLAPLFPQQPFGFTGPDIAGGDPLTPVLSVSLIPEPASLLLWGLGGLGLGWRRLLRGPASAHPGPAA